MLRIFTSCKTPSTSAGFEPANIGSRCEHVNPGPLRTTNHYLLPEHKLSRLVVNSVRIPGLVDHGSPWRSSSYFSSLIVGDFIALFWQLVFSGPEAILFHQCWWYLRQYRLNRTEKISRWTTVQKPEILNNCIYKMYYVHRNINNRDFKIMTALRIALNGRVREYQLILGRHRKLSRTSWQEVDYRMLVTGSIKVSMSDILLIPKQIVGFRKTQK